MHEGEAEKQGVAVTPRVIKGFWARVEKDVDPNGCWLWHGARRADGYGLAQLRWLGRALSSGRPKQKMVMAHRLSWRIAHGDWPPEFNENRERLVVMHSCDVRNCVAPHHLSMGAYADNSADMARKGRASQGDEHYSRVEPERLARGEAVGTAKLTEAQAAVIKGELEGAPRTEKGEVRQGVAARLAEHFGVSLSTLHDIKTGHIWEHVAPAVIERSILPARLARKFANAKLDLAQAIEVHRLRALGMTIPALAEKFGGTTSMIWCILHGRTWPDALGVVKSDPTKPLRVDRHARGSAHHNAKLTAVTVAEIRTRATAGEAWISLVTEFTAKLGVRPPAIYDVLNGKTWSTVMPPTTQ